MRFVPLVWAMLWRSRARTWLTFASIVVAFFLFGMLQTILDFFEGGVRLSLADNVLIQARSPAAPMPISYRDRIARVSGVKTVVGLLFFPAWVGDRKNFVPTMAVSMIGDDLDPRFVIPDAQRRAWFKTRTGAIAGKELAKKYGWKLGDHIALQSSVPRRDGSAAWEFDIVGFFEYNRDLIGNLPAESLLANYDYINEGQIEGAESNTVEVYFARIENPRLADGVCRAIDAMFANSPSETRAEPEAQVMLREVEQLGDIGLIVHAVLGAVFFALALVAGNTMMQAFRERTAELGVLKTLGFRDGQLGVLVVVEALLLALGAGAAGLALADVAIPAAAHFSILRLPEIHLSNSDLLAGIGIAALLGLAAAAIPAWLSRRLTVIEALARQ